MTDSFKRLVTCMDKNTPPDDIRAQAYELVATMTREEAIDAMELLITFMDEECVRTVLLLRGNLLDRLEDAMFLSTTMRQHKWEQKHLSQQSVDAIQKQQSVTQQNDSERRLLNRRRNRVMLEDIRVTKPEREETCIWTISLEELATKSPPFWFALPLEGCTEREQRLTVAVLEELASTFGKGRFPPSLWQRYDEILQSFPVPQPTIARAIIGTRKHWMYQWCCHFTCGLRIVR